MQKINHIKEYAQLYNQPKSKVSLIEVPSLNFLMIDGKGDPNNNLAYSEAVGAIYSIAYKLKFMIKNGPLAVDYKVMPLEGLWWAEEMTLFNLEDRSNWQWRMMIMQPEYINDDLFDTAFDFVKKKKDPPKLDEVQFKSFQEGLVMQIYHQGPYGDGERETIEKLHAQIETDGYKLSGKHHEIYFNSPLHTAPENLRTIIRQPVKTG